jgi:hypothetical protein
MLLLADFAIKSRRKFLQDVSGHVYYELDTSSTRMCKPVLQTLCIPRRYSVFSDI